MRDFKVFTALLAVAAIFAGCNAPPDPRRTNFKVDATVDGMALTAKYDDKTGRLRRIDVDQNKNGRIETFGYWDGNRLLKIEIDLDENGVIERWEHYGEGNRLERVGTSSKGDGVEDTWSYPDAEGLVLKEEFDTDRDGRVDKRDTYAAPPGAPGQRVLSIVELNLDKDGHPERRLHYRPDGQFDRVERLRP